MARHLVKKQYVSPETLRKLKKNFHVIRETFDVIEYEDKEDGSVSEEISIPHQLNEMNEG